MKKVKVITPFMQFDAMRQEAANFSCIVELGNSRPDNTWEVFITYTTESDLFYLGQATVLNMIKPLTHIPKFL